MRLPLPRLSECPTCQAPTDMIETLETAWFCNGCAEAFELSPEGRIVRRHATQHEPRRWYVDVQGHPITDE